MTSRVPFAGLAPDARTTRSGEALTAFELDAAIAMGEELRRAIAREPTLDVLARRLVDAVNSFDEEGRPACILVRAVDAASQRLLASAGIERRWNEGAAFEVREAPIVVDLTRQLRSNGSVHLASPPGDFLRAYDLRTTFALASASVVVVAFARVTVARKTTRLFELLGLYGKLGLIGHDEGERRDTLEQLVVLQAMLARESVFDYRQRMHALALAAEAAAKAANAQATSHAADLRRSQRAMLNVIEDLREARSSLETTVAVRTRELASRNKELEEFVYIASHDLQEPLRTVAGYLQMIERRYGEKLGPEGDEFIRFAIEGAQRMQALIESLLLYSRVATAEKRVDAVPLDEVVDTALRNVALRIEETGARSTAGRCPPSTRIAFRWFRCSRTSSAIPSSSVARTRRKFAFAVRC